MQWPLLRLPVQRQILARWRGRIEAFLATSDPVKVSAEDPPLLYPQGDASAVVEWWLAAGSAVVVVTRGPDGLPGARIVEVVRVAAGDSFMAALIAWLAKRGITDRAGLASPARVDDVALLTFAAGAAAITCSRRGADPPRRTEREIPGRASVEHRRRPEAAKTACVAQAHFRKASIAQKWRTP